MAYFLATDDTQKPVVLLKRADCCSYSMLQCCHNIQLRIRRHQNEVNVIVATNLRTAACVKRILKYTKSNQHV